MGKQEHILTYDVHISTLKEDITEIMDNWLNEAKIDVNKINMDFASSSTFENELKKHIDKLLEERLIELLSNRRSKFMVELYNILEIEGFERNCYGCYMVEKQYGKMQ